MMFLLKLVARLPLPLLHGAGIVLGWLLYWSPGRYSTRVRNNLFDSGICVPGCDCRALLRKSIGEAGKAMIELLPVWLRPYQKVLRLVRRTSGWEHIDAARAAGLRVMIGCFCASSVSLTAAAQLAGQADWCDLDGHLLVANDPFVGLVAPGGRMKLPDGPGLGVRPRD